MVKKSTQAIVNATRYRQASLQIPNDLSYLPVAISFVQQNAALRGFGKDQLNRIELGVEEAVSNVIQHAYKSEERADFSITCEQIPRGLRIIVRDKGAPFDPDVLPEYDPKAVSMEIPERGLGWYLMQKSVDEVIFHNLGPEGKEIHLVKYLYQEEEEQLPDDTRDMAAEQVATIVPQTDHLTYKVRKAKPKDAVGIAKCAYDAYGYSYKEWVYYPERLKDMIAKGGLLSAIAVTEEEEVIAHGALVFEHPEEKIAELGMAFTKWTYQGRGCGRKIGLFLIKEAIKQGLRGVYGYATTAHNLSQRAANKSGARDCCILIGDAPADRKNQNFSAGGGRGTRVYGHMSTQLFDYLKIQLKTKKIYAPAHHLEMIGKIYANLNEKVTFVTDDGRTGEMPEGLPLIDTYTKPARQSARIKIKKYGDGIVEQVQRILRKLCIDKYEVITLYLNLGDPMTPEITQAFESLGFFFIGIIPGAKSGDQLALQYLNNILIDYDSIQLYTNFAVELLHYIKSRDPLQNSQ